MATILAVDVGGTQIRVAAYQNGSAEPTTINKVATRGEGSVSERILATIQKTWPITGNVDKIVIALPGPLDPAQGIIFSAPNLPEWKNYAIGPEIEQVFGVRTLIGNDANLAALGEWKYGSGIGHNDLAYFTVSTGIGSGIISGGNLIVGRYGLAGEIGHILLEPNGPPCSCGQRGHVESFCSGLSIVKFAKQQISHGRKSSLANLADFSAKDLSQAAQQGDALSREAIERAGRYLGYAMVSVVHTFNPSILIFGGGVSQNGDLLFDPIRETLQDQVMDPTYIKDLIITSASLGDNAGLMGAHALGLLPDQ